MAYPDFAPSFGASGFAMDIGYGGGLAPNYLMGPNSRIVPPARAEDTGLEDYVQRMLLLPHAHRPDVFSVDQQQPDTTPPLILVEAKALYGPCKLRCGLLARIR